jgi:hypothetical protein
MVGTTPATCPRRPAGADEHLLCPMLPRHRPTPWPWTSARVGPLGLRRRRSRDAGQAAALATVDLMGVRHGQPPHHPFPSGPRQAGDHAARGPRRHVDPLRPAGAAHHTEPLQGPARPGQRGGSAADTRGLSVRTPGCTGRLDTGRPPDRLDGRPQGGQWRRTVRRTAWLASGHPRCPRRRRPPAGWPKLAWGCSVCGARQPMTACDDETCRRGTKQLPSTARHEAAPRRTALLKRESPGVRRRVGG